MKRKYLLLTLIAILLGIICMQKAEAAIYISEIIEGSEKLQAATLLSVFKDDGAAIKEITVPGIMVRVSPDQQSVVYVGMPSDQAKTVLWDVFISDMQQTKTRAFPFIKPPQKRGRSIAGMEWSPQGDKLLLLLAVALRDDKDYTYPVDVIVYDLTASTFRKITSLRADSLNEAPLIHAGWFPDNRRVWTREISSRKGGAVKVIDTETSSTQTIYEGMADVQPSRNGHVLYLIVPDQKSSNKDTQSSQSASKNANLKRYDVQAQKMQDLGTIPYSPRALIGKSFLLGADSDHLFLVKEHVKSLAEYQISSQTATEKQSPDLLFVPKAASPRDNHVACGYGHDMHKQAGYGVMNYKTMQYRKMKGIAKNAQSGEAAWGGLLLNRIEWF
ncbi:MAG: hypothetical protein AABZ10_02110 [Nitrospirota bacterium]